MAQAATMGPPLSPREPRRSGRRSAPFSSAPSKSPDSDLVPRQKDFPLRPALVSNNSSNNSRNKRPKQEDFDDPIDDKKNGSSHSSSSTNGAPNGRTKRKPKEKDKQVAVLDNVTDTSLPPVEDVPADVAEDDEQGITRCVCGSTEDDPDAGEFMVQCETCKVWQHGLCMGYQSEDQVHDDDYYCEQCRPHLHTELLKKLAKRPRQSSANSHAPASRVSRSHSPVYVKQPSKRRNTMNSRDAAFDESIKEIIEASAAEAAAHGSVATNASDSVSANLNHSRTEPEEDIDTALNNRKKRKRTEDDSVPKKRTRSASTTSDQQAARPETPINGVQQRPLPPPPLPPPVSSAPKSSGRNKRSGRKPPPLESVNQDGEEAAPPRRSGGGRAKAAANKRAAAAAHGPGRSNSAEATRAFRNSHAYAVSQQPLFTSWGLPDYLAHLEEMLPTDTPQPLEVRAGPGGGAGGRESVERTVERGVKVKWPSKRMSVGDMNKRVRALVEWVGREQAIAQDRQRRREALEKALKEDPANDSAASARGRSVASNADTHMNMDDEDRTPNQNAGHNHPKANHVRSIDASKSTETMKMMEELMEELISFQEKFGPGAKSRDRERRTATAS